MTISKFEIEQAQKKIDEIESQASKIYNLEEDLGCANEDIESLKQVALNRLIEIERLTEELKASNRKLKFSSEWIDDCEGDFEFTLYKNQLSEVK